MIVPQTAKVPYTWIRTKQFARCFGRKTSGYEAVVALGANMGDAIRRFEKLLVVLSKRKGIEVIATSYIMKNPAVGYENQADFFNTVIRIQTKLSPHALLDALLRLEKRFGRKRPFKNAPRTLDLDLIFYEHRVIDSKKLTLPHPFWNQRAFVYMPLMALGNCT